MLGDREYMRSSMYERSIPSWKTRSVVTKLIIANVVVFLLQIITEDQLTSLVSLKTSDFPQVWRIITYMFAHGSFGHIFLNMWSLYIFGKQVEQQIGQRDFLRLYLVSGIVGAAFWGIFNIGSPYGLIGASGAIFGVMGAAAMLFPNTKIFLLFPPIVLKVRTLVICLAILNVFMLHDSFSNIAYLAHLGGLFGGYIYLKMRSQKSSHTPWESTQNNKQSFDFDMEKFFSVIKEKVSTPAEKKHTTPRSFKFVKDIDSMDDDDVISTEVDPILDKIGRYGIKSLTAAERKVLEQARRKLK